MGGRFWISLAAVAVLMAGTGAARAQAPSSPNQGAEQNVRESQQYEQLLCSNPTFRAKRIAQECGPLQGSQFYQGCVASFQCGAVRSSPNWRRAPPSERIR